MCVTNNVGLDGAKAVLLEAGIAGTVLEPRKPLAMLAARGVSSQSRSSSSR
jgi:hypothetical protein